MSTLSSGVPSGWNVTQITFLASSITILMILPTTPFKAKVKEDIEFYSVMRSVRAIEHCDVCILVVDATRGFDGQVQGQPFL